MQEQKVIKMNEDKVSKEVANLATKTLSELLAETDRSIYFSLKNSVYPGARDESIAMVIAYCKAKKYDPLAKCCHIVPMSVKDAKTKEYEWRDVIMPGIAGYRIDADRTGQYMGMSDPEFGPMKTEKLGNKSFTFPEWCKITVKKRLATGDIAEYPAIEYWMENYATKGKDSIEPNAMWAKRPRGQIAKCAEAQALRKAFPDVIGSNVTFEEMEGKTAEKETKGEILEAPAPQLISEEQVKQLLEKIEATNSDLIGLCNYFKIGTLEELPTQSFERLVGMLNQKAAKQQPQKPDVDTTVKDFFGDETTATATSTTVKAVG